MGASTWASANEVISLCTSRLSYLPAFIHPRSNNVDSTVQYLDYLHEEVKARAAVGMHPSQADMGLSFFFA